MYKLERYYFEKSHRSEQFYDFYVAYLQNDLVHNKMQ